MQATVQMQQVESGVQNRAVDVIAVCHADGTLRPLRFRYEDGEHRLRSMRVDEVLCCKPIEYVGVEAFIYSCRAWDEAQEHLFELKYTVRSHCWTLFRVLY